MAGFLDLIKVLGSGIAPVDSTTADLKTRADGNAGSKYAIYPSDLFTPANEPHILFIRRDPTVKGAQSPDKVTATRIALYMPPAIKVNYGTSWEPLQMTVQQWKDFGEDAYNIGKKLVNGQYALPEVAQTAIRGVSQAIDFAGNTTLTDQFERATGRTINPHMALLFKGVDFRQFAFDFQLMARTSDEAESIKEIVKAFKSAMHPSKAEEGTRFWAYPDNFDIFLSTGLNTAGKNASPYLFQISTSVLTNMSVDYAGSGIPSFFYDNGAPVDVRMSLEFKELGVLTREKIHEGF